MKHGAYRNTQEESTAFGSKFEVTATAQIPPYPYAPRAVARGQEGSCVPNEVIALCQEIVEVRWLTFF